MHIPQATRLYASRVVFDLVGGCGKRQKMKQDMLGARDAGVIQRLANMLNNMLWPRGCLYALLALAELACDHEQVSTSHV
jgi:hypothetical protein